MNCARIATNCDARKGKVNKINTIAILAKANKMSEVLYRKINTIAIPQFIPPTGEGIARKIPLMRNIATHSPSAWGLS